MKILLINPPVYDFSAYNLWARPIALIKLATYFKKNKIQFDYFDFMDISLLTEEEKKFFKIKLKYSGRHTYPKIETKKPNEYKFMKRKFFRFGVPEHKFFKFLENIKVPDYIIVTSIMTYWYLGCFEIIKFLKKFFPNSKIIFGGIYVNLCYEHAKKYSNADYIVRNLNEIFEILGLPVTYDDNIFFPLNLDVYRKNYFAPIYTSFGCPYSCAYCANKFLNKTFIQRDVDIIVEEIMWYYEKYQIINFAFYDDALLINRNNHFFKLMEKLIRKNIKISFYCPNGVHISQIDSDVADIMKRMNFQDIRLSLETANEILQKEIGYKTNKYEFVKAVETLKKFGFTEKELSCYLLVGLPFQTIEDIVDSINFAKYYRIKVKLAEYSPIPHTKLWEKSIQNARYNIEEEPLYQNHKILPVAEKRLDFNKLNWLKNLAHRN